MRNEQAIKNLIVEKAKSDDRVRAVLLNGSRANITINPDKLQDFDIVYIVRHIETFITDRSWLNSFGKRLIWQLPDEMELYTEIRKKGEPYTYLMLFEDGNRIDLTLVPAQKIHSNYIPESLTMVWLDKDESFLNLPKSNDSDYVVKRPTEKEFLDTCNEFWWVCTYVAKGLVRSEITYAKHNMETVVRPMFMKMIGWHIGVRTNFSVAIGKYGKNIKKHMSEETYNGIMGTYSDHRLDNNWQALDAMTKIFGVFAQLVADICGYNYCKSEEHNVVEYIKKLRANKQ